MTYTNLDIIDAIRLVKAGCKDVTGENEQWSNLDLPACGYVGTLEEFIEMKYRISSDKLAEWNNNHQCQECGGSGISQDFAEDGCSECNGTGTIEDIKE